MLYYVSSYIYFSILLLAVIAGLIVLFKRKGYSYLRLLAPFLIITLSVEVVAHVLSLNKRNNAPLFNLYIPFNISFYYFVFLNIFQAKRNKIFTLVACIVYPIFAYSWMYFNGIDQFPTMVYGFGVSFLLLFCVLYFYELMDLPEMPKLLSHPDFLISMGILFFYGASLPTWSAVNLMNDISGSTLGLYSVIILLLNCILYSFFIAAFIFSLKKPANLQPIKKRSF
ncbi:MAG: hypothetical protein P0Y53_07160 [Candidatus Pseudobacter hemicellulosilyticus]|uniref:Uncharacterized protein n=1 Tax=Candidatus Pseudobacter hemicellulosilyticus TaxID=3121375 RepID=A0AAJ5WZH9_9BACT|nr:MAG: hypothetical protein P0Y53_07160 [Pseudobacter sp.]